MDNEIPRDRLAIRAYCKARLDEHNRRTLSGKTSSYTEDLEKMLKRVAAELPSDEFAKWGEIYKEESWQCVKEYQERVDNIIAGTGSPLYRLVIPLVVVAAGAAVLFGLVTLFH